MREGAGLVATLDYSEDRLTEKIIECIINVHRTLGPGFLERIYHNALLIDLEM
jgi:hypothetical protein